MRSRVVFDPLLHVGPKLLQANFRQFDGTISLAQQRIGVKSRRTVTPSTSMLKCLIQLLFPRFSKVAICAFLDPWTILIFAMKSGR